MMITHVYFHSCSYTFMNTFMNRHINNYIKFSFSLNINILNNFLHPKQNFHFKHWKNDYAGKLKSYKFYIK